MIKRIINKFLDDPRLFLISIILRIGFLLPDKIYLSLLFRLKLGHSINWNNPKSFNEKLNWLKIYERKPEYTKYVDKYDVKSLIKKVIGREYVADVLGVWNSIDEIDFEKLPDQFVLKVNHTSGGVVVVRDKRKFDFSKYKEKFNKLLKTNYYYSLREYPYKNVKPVVFAEQFLENFGQENLVVYKVFCFEGFPKIIQVIQDDKQTNETIDYFDCEWNLLDLKQNFPNSRNHLPKPSLLGDMLEKSKLLSQNIPFVRVDWYIVNNILFFSEFTFYSDSGLEKFIPNKWDYILGDYIKLPSERNN